MDTATNAFTAQNLNTITSTSALEGPSGVVQLGKTGDRFRTIISGHLNAPPGPPSAFMTGYTYTHRRLTARLDENTIGRNLRDAAQRLGGITRARPDE